MEKNIVLTGFMGTGKTEVGRIIAQRLGYMLVDADDEIEREQKMKISEIFGTLGEPAFRDIEAAVIRRISQHARSVISTGGGAVLRQENIDNLRLRGVMVCLIASPETIFNRTKRSSDRPLLKVDDPLGKIRELLASRQACYRKADISIDTEGKTPVEVAEEIIELMNERNGK